MASKNPLIQLGHIRAEIESIMSRLSGVDRQTFIQDYLLLRADERALLIISEAAKSILSCRILAPPRREPAVEALIPPRHIDKQP